MKKTFTNSHPVIFICDHKNQNVTIPDDIEKTITSHNETCISVWTLAYVDGDITVILSDEIKDADRAGYQHVFSGTISCPNNIIDVTTSENKSVLSQPIDGNTASVNIWVDDLKYPENLLIEAKKSED